ncbi:MAG TPA: thioredoxin, partial [Clostridiales bacterium]|nr:thioredoxin [Clostridiales bacterium]
MDDENTMKSKKGIAIKIIIPILLVCVVVGIWIVKNSKKSTDYAVTEKSGSAITDNYELKSIDNLDFALNVTEKIDLEKLKTYGLPIVIDFGAGSCIPCKKMAPVLKELNAELQGKTIVKFVDVWKYQKLAEGYPISVIPTQI